MSDTRTGQLSFFKVPSSPADPSEAIAEGTRELLARFGVEPQEVEYFGHGTTVATNMVIERRGVSTGLITTRGFRDVLAIGRQTRPALYDYAVQKPAPLVRRAHRLENEERLDAGGNVLRPLDETALEEQVRELVAAGVQSLAIVFIHAYRNPGHEEQARRVVQRVAPSLHVSISSEVLPEFREFERTSTTVLNAYVAPRMQQYLDRLCARMLEVGVQAEPLTFHSNGGLMPTETVKRLPVLTCLSGPAAGVVGSTMIGAATGLSEIITFDVGGTSTDVSLITAQRPSFTSDRLIAGYPVKMPMVDIHVVGAGGGSIARLDDIGALKVGPESAGAVPGPVAFRKGGSQVTVTDVNIVLGRLHPERLLDGRMAVDRRAAVAAIESQIARPLGLSVEEAAYGILRIATASMSRAIRAISNEHGHDAAEFVLFAFGGAGPLHAAEVAQECGMSRVLIPNEPGTMCARGILLSDVSRDLVRTQLAPLDDASWKALGVLAQQMQDEGNRWLQSEKVPEPLRRFHLAIDARYRGQTHDIRVPVRSVEPGGRAAFEEAFHRCHQAQYGHDHAERPIEVVTCRMQAVGQVPKPDIQRTGPAAPANRPAGRRDVYFGEGHGWVSTPVLHRDALAFDTERVGPLVIEEMSSTTVVPPGTRMRVDPTGNIQLEI